MGIQTDHRRVQGNLHLFDIDRILKTLHNSNIKFSSMPALILKHKIFSMTDFKRNSEAIYQEMVESGKSGIIVQDSNPYLLVKPLKPKQLDSVKLKQFQKKIKDKILQADKARIANYSLKVNNQDIDSTDL